MLIGLRSRWLEVDHLGTVTVAKFTTTQILDEEKVHNLGEQLLRLGDQIDAGALLLDFTGVQRMSSEMLGQLIRLQVRLKARGGKLAICGVDQQLAELFKTVRLAEVIPIYPGEQEALQSL